MPQNVLKTSIDTLVRPINLKTVKMWAIIGKLTAFVILFKFTFSILKGLYGSFFGAFLGLNLNIKKTGKWAVVTGSTDGIGKAYAFEIARRGLNIVLISRSPHKLQDVAAEINSKYKVETKIIDVDFTQTDIYERIRKELEGLDIGVLINNVGMSYNYPEYFNDIPNGYVVCDRLVNCNIVSVMKMTRIVLPGMSLRKRGLIVNVSSLSSAVNSPLLSVYAATKAFVESFSKSIAMEYEDRDVTVQCVMPGFVVTNMSKIRKSSLMCPLPADYVKSTLKTTGIERRTGGYFMHKIQIFLIELAFQYMPGFIPNTITFDQLKTIREKALKRIQREIKAD